MPDNLPEKDMAFNLLRDNLHDKREIYFLPDNLHDERSVHIIDLAGHPEVGDIDELVDECQLCRQQYILSTIALGDLPL